MEEQRPDSPQTLTANFHDLLSESDNEAAQFSFQEETIEEVMQEFYKEIAFPASPVPPNPSPISPPFMDNGVNGSCGATVSDSASTVMAGIDLLSPAGGFSVTEVGVPLAGIRSPAEELEDGIVGEEKKMEGFDAGNDDDDDDDEWLWRVLSWNQQSQVQAVGD